MSKTVVGTEGDLSTKRSAATASALKRQNTSESDLSESNSVATQQTDDVSDVDQGDNLSVSGAVVLAGGKELAALLGTSHIDPKTVAPVNVVVENDGKHHHGRDALHRIQKNTAYNNGGQDYINRLQESRNAFDLELKHNDVMSELQQRFDDYSKYPEAQNEFKKPDNYTSAYKSDAVLEMMLNSSNEKHRKAALEFAKTHPTPEMRVATKK